VIHHQHSYTLSELLSAGDGPLRFLVTEFVGTNFPKLSVLRTTKNTIVARGNFDHNLPTTNCVRGSMKTLKMQNFVHLLINKK